MGELIGYGEDALTLWALANRLDDILKKLEDETDPSECLAFYRPSFGRGGRDTANFGEFDAILSTRTCVYLVESKWEGSAKSFNRIKLADAQTNRHQTFREYFSMWDSSAGVSSLVQTTSGSVRNAKNRRLVREWNQLAKHLTFVLSRIAERPDNGAKKNIANVLMLLHRQDGEPSPLPKPEGFEHVIAIRGPRSVDIVGNSWFFRLDIPPSRNNS